MTVIELLKKADRINSVDLPAFVAYHANVFLALAQDQRRMEAENKRLREGLAAIAKMGVTTVHHCQPAAVAKAALDALEAPECPKCRPSRMQFASGEMPYHDLKYPHWRCEAWVGGGVCGKTLPISQGAE